MCDIESIFEVNIKIKKSSLHELDWNENKDLFIENIS